MKENITYDEYLEIEKKEGLFPNQSLAYIITLIRSSFLFGERVGYTEEVGFKDGSVTQYHDMQSKFSGPFVLQEDVFGWRGLDVGCREFYSFEYFSRKNIEMYGIDVCEKAIQANEKRPVKFPLFNIDAHHMNEIFPKEFFDLIVSYHSMEHMYDRNRVLRNCYELLKPNRYLFVDAPIDKPGEEGADHFSPIRSVEDFIMECKKIGFRGRAVCKYTLTIGDPARGGYEEHPEGFIALFYK